MESVVAHFFGLDVTCKASQDAQDDGVFLVWEEEQSAWDDGVCQGASENKQQQRQPQVLRLRYASLRMTACFWFGRKSDQLGMTACFWLEGEGISVRMNSAQALWNQSCLISSF